MFKYDTNLTNYEWHSLVCPVPAYPAFEVNSTQYLYIALEVFNKSDAVVYSDYALGYFLKPDSLSYLEPTKIGTFMVTNIIDHRDFAFRAEDCTFFDTLDGHEESEEYRIIAWKYMEPFKYPGMDEFRKELETVAEKEAEL